MIYPFNPLGRVLVGWFVGWILLCVMWCRLWPYFFLMCNQMYCFHILSYFCLLLYRLWFLKWDPWMGSKRIIWELVRSAHSFTPPHTSCIWSPGGVESSSSLFQQALQLILMPVGVCTSLWELLFKEGQALYLCTGSHPFSDTLGHWSSQLAFPVSDINF